jgi:hypothetical protein
VPKAKSSVADKVPYRLSAISRFRTAHPDKAQDLGEAEACLLHGGIRLDLDKVPTIKVLRNSTTPLHMVLKAGKKPHLVLDCSRNLNVGIRHKAFTYQSLQYAVDLYTPRCYDSVTQLLFCTEERTQGLLALFDHFSQQSSVTVKQARSLAGKFSFAALCISGARPFFRRIIKRH